FDPDLEARQIHHREHVLETAVFLADQVTYGTVLVAVGHDAGRTAMDTELVLDGYAPDVVAYARAAVRVDQMLGHGKQGDPLHTLGGVRGSREHQMDDIVDHVVLTPGDEDLRSIQPVVIAFGHGPRTHGGQIGTGLRLGQIHGAGPCPADQLAQIRLF